MDNPELANLNQVELDSALDQPERGVLARDKVTGSILVVPREIARAWLRFKHSRRARDPETDRQDQLKIASLLHSVQYLRQVGRAGQKGFNPLFLRLPLFEVAPFQPYLEGLSRAVVGQGYVWMTGLLLVAALWMGIESDWAIAAAYSNIFSPEALLTFGIAAPLLKIFHELGHVLAATRYGTRVAKAGILFIALFPIPFVDCSDSDVSANRLQRVVISLAGLLTDILLGLLVFIAWHFTTGDFLQSLLGNLFVYLTLNSLLFNANPLVKLDGYFALIDLVRFRNLSQEGGKRFKSMQVWLGSFGRQGELPDTPGDIAILVYATLSFVYRIYIIGFIAYSLFPRYMGVGAGLVVWGLIALFFSPLARSPGQAGKQASPESAPVWRVRLGVAALITLVIAFFPVAVRQQVPVFIAVGSHYAVTAPETGQLSSLSPYREFAPGELLAQIDSAALREQLAERQAELGVARLTLDAVRDSDPLRAETARDRLASVSEQITQLETRLGNGQLVAAEAGIFIPRPDLRPGDYLEAGAPIGAFYPAQGGAVMSGQFPERYVPYFRSSVRAAELRHDGRYMALDPEDLTLQETVSVNRQSGQRLYTLQAVVPLPPSHMTGSPGHVLVEFRTEPLWQRLAFHLRGLMQNLQDARLAETERRLN